VASCDTAAADRNRADQERGLWGEGGSGPIEAERTVAPLAPKEILASATGEDAAEKEAVRETVSAVMGTAPRTDEAPTVADQPPPAEKPDA
jgi:hypothetical protein